MAGGKPTRLTDAALNATTPRWSADGASVYFLAAKDGVNQLWRVPAKGGEAERSARFPSISAATSCRRTVVRC